MHLVASAFVTRLLLVLTLIHGMVPAFGEVAEAVVHFATTGHLAHSGADGGDLGEQGGEHGCSPTHHRCDCCAPQPVVATAVRLAARVAWIPSRLAPVAAERLTPRAPDRPVRPPLA